VLIKWSRDTIAGSAEAPFCAVCRCVCTRGRTTIEFVSENPGIHIPTDTRLLAIMVRDLEIRTETRVRLRFGTLAVRSAEQFC